jgi:hypothetical protein
VIARAPATAGMPISGIGGITTWRDAAEFIALGAGNVQVCTAAMVYGFKIVQDLCDGLSNFMDEQGHASVADMVGLAVPSIVNWNQLNLNHIEKAVIAPGHHGNEERAAPLRGAGRRMCGLQPVRVDLPGAGLHRHEGAAAR